MALTLTEGAKLSNNVVLQGVVETIVKEAVKEAVREAVKDAVVGVVEERAGGGK